jgi:hypothetical protein
MYHSCIAKTRKFLNFFDFLDFFTASNRRDVCATRGFAERKLLNNWPRHMAFLNYFTASNGWGLGQF